MQNITTKLIRARNNFERAQKAQEEFVRSLPFIQKNIRGRCIPINKEHQERFCEMAFVILFTGWEQFLESTFESRIVDARLSDFKTHNRVLVVDLDTAHDLIRGTRRFAEWADPDPVRERAKLFFKGGEPFESALSSILDDLKKMRIIRNCCVHYSQHAIEQYKNMTRQVFGSSRTITPGRLLLNAPPIGLSTASGATSYGSSFQFYSEILSTACCQIVPLK